MKQVLAILAIVFGVVAIIAISFTVNQVNNEQQRLQADIQYRSTLLAESLREVVERNFINNSNVYLQSVVDKFTNKERLEGLAIFDNKEKIVVVSSSLPASEIQTNKIVSESMDSDKASGDFLQFKNKKFYIFVIPLHDDSSVVGALAVVQNADYIDTRIKEIWTINFVRLLTQLGTLSVAMVFILYWIIYRPIKGIVESIQSARMGAHVPTDSGASRRFGLFQPLVNEFGRLEKSLNEARLIANEEALLRHKQVDSPWTSHRLQEFIKDSLKGRPIVVVSNREPYVHTHVNGSIKYHIPASGMVTALEPIMQACAGEWIAWGSGDADKVVVDKDNIVKVPPEEPRYNLRRVWLTAKDEKEFYDGFSNDAMWPLCHNTYTRPTFRKDDWEGYKRVNGKFAHTVLTAIKSLQRPIILIQDFHFALLPQMIKQSRKDAMIGLFWHIPWPNPESFSICPWKNEVLEGMLGADLIGFHTQLFCNNFIGTVSREVESLINYEKYSITKSKHTSFVRPFAISIAVKNGESEIDQKKAAEERQKLCKDLGINVPYIGVGVDRLDYSKGLLERFKAIETFLLKNPDYINKFVFIQIAAPSRTKVLRYQEYSKRVVDEANRINTLFKQDDWKPIILLTKHHPHEKIEQYYRISNVCLLTPLQDGMNLVAKEYIESRSDEKGVLIISKFAGAANELDDALIVNPYNAEETADAIKTALAMPLSEQTKRMKILRESVKQNNIYRWSAEYLKTLASLE
jgi:trehalose 6-phosphate synthase